MVVGPSELSSLKPSTPRPLKPPPKGRRIPRAQFSKPSRFHQHIMGFLGGGVHGGGGGGGVPSKNLKVCLGSHRE